MQHPIVRVFVNKVEVGALPEPQYQQILAEVEREVKDDRYRLYCAQAVGLLLAASRAGRLYLKLLLWMFIATVVTGIFARPDLMAEIIGVVRQTTPANLVSGAQLVLIWGALLGVVVVLLATALSNFKFGYVNQFRSARATGLSRRIRTVLEVSAEGHMDIYENGTAPAHG